MATPRPACSSYSPDRTSPRTRISRPTLPTAAKTAPKRNTAGWPIRSHAIQRRHLPAAARAPKWCCTSPRRWRYEVGGQGLAHGAERALIKPVKDEQRPDESDIPRQGKAKIGREEHD